MNGSLDIGDAQFAKDMQAWLLSSQDRTWPKYLYDAEGSRLFEEICRLPDYYLTLTEIRLLKSIGADLSATIPAGAALVEFGSGASEKTRTILDAAPQISTYVPIDISPTALDEAAKAIRADYPHLQVQPLVGDFTTALHLPKSLSGAAKVGFFPGSTIGNITADQAHTFLQLARSLLGEDAAFIVGIDIAKDESTLLAAYNDTGGVNRDFNKNLLTRINRELGGDFDLSAFDHRAVWNEDKSRMEMYLISRCEQIVHVAGQEFRLARGQNLHVQNSHKFTPNRFDAMVAAAGWTTQRRWVNDAPKFAVFLLKAPKKGSGQQLVDIGPGGT